MRGQCLALGLLLIVVAGCEEARWDRVRAPSGDGWLYVVSCTDGVVRCYADAREACHGNYEIVGGNEKGSQTVAGAVGGRYGAVAASRTYNEHEMTVRCGNESERDEAQSTPVAPPATPGPDLTTCAKDFEHFSDVAQWWAGRNADATPRERPPSRSAFLGVCGELPEATQLCLNRAYESTHEEACAQPLARSKKTLDRLLLVTE
jgi:hypothetical protein